VPALARSGFQKRHYDDLARTRRGTRYGLSCGYDDRFDPALLERRPLLRRAWTRLLDRIFGSSSVGSLLDLGSGTGYYWPLLARRCDRLVGVDVSRGMLEAGRRHRARHGDELHQVVAGEGARLPFATGSFDAALAVDSLHHAGELGPLVSELGRVLRPGGTFAAVEPNVLNPVVLVAHALPAEERGAIWPASWIAAALALQRSFDLVRSEPVTYVSGVGSEAALRFVEAVEPILGRPPLSALALRRLLVARRRP